MRPPSRLPGWHPVTTRSDGKKRLDGRIILVTGAWRGVGRGHALTLAAKGARLVINDPGSGARGPDLVDPWPAEEVVELIRSQGGEPCVSVVDISTWAGASDAVGRAVRDYGQLDGLDNLDAFVVNTVSDAMFLALTDPLYGSNEWVRVDGENFAVAPLESIVARHPDARSVAVYAVPDDPVGDRVMVALDLTADANFDRAAFDEFLDGQPDLGTKGDLRSCG